MNKIRYILILLFFLPFYGISSDTSSYVSGQKLFRKNCSNCHNVHKEIIGPMLASITKKRQEVWLISFIKNSQNVILSNDPYATHLFSQYNRTVMPSFDHLSDDEIKDILQYIEKESKVKQAYSINESFNYLPGKELFKNHCSTCHQLNSEDYGPSLGSIYRRRPLPWIVEFVTNSQATIKGGDPYADFVFNEFDRKVMPPFTFLDEQSINDIVLYIDAVSKSPTQIAGVNGNKINITPVGEPIPSYRFLISEKPESPDGIFGKIAFCAITIVSGYILFVILKKFYLYLFKSQK